jgi:hypothetical protein
VVRFPQVFERNEETIPASLTCQENVEEALLIRDKLFLFNGDNGNFRIYSA